VLPGRQRSACSRGHANAPRPRGGYSGSVRACDVDHLRQSASGRPGVTAPGARPAGGQQRSPSLRHVRSRTTCDDTGKHGAAPPIHGRMGRFEPLAPCAYITCRLPRRMAPLGGVVRPAAAPSGALRAIDSKPCPRSWRTFGPRRLRRQPQACSGCPIGWCRTSKAARGLLAWTDAACASAQRRVPPPHRGVGSDGLPPSQGRKGSSPAARGCFRLLCWP
jgi:hypothetical protein